MGKWEMVKLGEVATVVSGSTPKTSVGEYWNGEHNWVTPAELNDSVIVVYETKRKITNKAIENLNLTPLPVGTVLLSSRAPIGKVAIAGVEMYCNQGFKNLICSDKIHNKYLFWFLKGRTDFLNSLGRGATFKEISKSIVEQIRVPLPPLETQKHIAKTLDTVAELLAMCKQQLAELDNLVKSVFYDMFGDPIRNEKGWELARLKDIATKIGSGATPRGGRGSYKNKGISLIRSMNVHNGVFRYEQLAYLDEWQAKQLDNVTVEENDVLINITGASVARSCIVPRDVLPARVNQHVSIIRLKKEKAIPEYINNVLTSNTFQTYLLSISGAGGATREAITKSQLQNLVVPLPPLDLQNQFTEIVTKTEEQTALVQKAIDETQYLFDSLMSEYFD